MTSLTATGTPASGGSGFPSATSASILSVCRRARSGDSVRKAFSSGFFSSILLKKSHANPRAETFFASSASLTPSIVQFVSTFALLCRPLQNCPPERSEGSASPPSRAVCMLLAFFHQSPVTTHQSLPFNHLRYSEIRRLGVRRVFQDVLRHRTRHNQILPQRGVGSLVVAQHLRHGLDLGCVQLVQLPDVFQNLVNLRAVHLQLALAQVEISQLRHTQHIFLADFHWRSLNGLLVQLPPSFADTSSRCNCRRAPGTRRPARRMCLPGSHLFARRCKQGSAALRQCPAG